MKNQATLIIGANSTIAKALARQVIKEDSTLLIVVSRDVEFYQQAKFNQSHIIRVADYQETTINAATVHLQQLTSVNITQVYICHGVLHNEQHQPEKRLADFSVAAFNQIITANTLTPMLWLKHLSPLLVSKSVCKIVIFSARVGSISDNQLGGWYSYRASKAATNMIIKSAAVEFARSAKNIKLIAFHPGTTDSPLSKPFQKNVPQGKLFSAEFVVEQLLKIMDEVNVDGEASFIDWQGKNIPW